MIKIGLPKDTLEDRFWGKVDKKGEDECWNWKAYKNKSGYGTFNRDNLAHRISWEICKSEIPEGMDVLHHCDNPSCVNPKHLFLGTQQDNK